MVSKFHVASTYGIGLAATATRGQSTVNVRFLGSDYH